MIDPSAAPRWFLRKHEDGTVFGPLPFAQLARWASSAQIAPHDSISTDQITWMKAPMMPELEMDWIAEVTSERLYGPTTLGAIREFLRLGEIDHDTYVINTRDASRQRMSEIAPFFEPAPSEEESLWNGHDPDFSGPAAAGMSIAIHDRIRELEQ